MSWQASLPTDQLVKPGLADVSTVDPDRLQQPDLVDTLNS